MSEAWLDETPHKSYGVLIAWLAIMIATSGCGQPGSTADWIISVPPETPIITAFAAPLDARSGDSIQLMRDLVLGVEDPDSPAFFGSVSDVAVDADGNVLVYDIRSYRVQVFREDGRFVRTIGGQLGSGPTDFGSRGKIAVVGDELAYFRSGAALLSLWRLADGSHIGTRRFGRRPYLRRFEGTSMGDLLVAFAGSSPKGQRLAVARYSQQGEEIHRYMEAPADYRVLFRTVQNEQSIEMTTSIPLGQATFAIGRANEVYLTAGANYHILAVTLDGEPMWALDVAWDRIPVTEQDIEDAMEAVRNLDPNAVSSQIEWPATMPALRSPAINVDGHGHLYVFPFPSDSSAPEAPVDVYSSSGELLHTGTMKWLPNSWRAARGDYVYAVEMSVATNEYQVVRYEIREPF